MARTKVFDEQFILDKAMHLFWEKGYNGTSAQDLVDGLGISRSSLYDTFGDKHSLFLKALQQYRVERIDPVLEEANRVTDAEDFIKKMFEFVKKESTGDDCLKGCLLVNSAVELVNVDKAVATFARGIMQDFETAMVKAIKSGQDAGVFKKSYSARTLARFVFNSLNGLRVTAKFDSSKKMFDDIVVVSMAALKA